MLYHVLGIVSSILFLLTWFGLNQQYQAIRKLKRNGLPATNSLSTNQFASSYFAFYANFIFGIAVEPFNHYLVWTRLGALLFLMAILVSLYQERRTVATSSVFWSAAIALVIGFLSMLYRPFPDIAKLATNSMMIMVTLILLQGTLHQIWVVMKSKSAGNLSFGLIQSILLKDISTVAFALTMPLSQAWPLLLLNGVSVFARGTLLIVMKKHA